MLKVFEIREGDDPRFMEGVWRLMSFYVSKHPELEVFFIRIDNWFDTKWLGFSGKKRVPFETRLLDPPKSLQTVSIPVWGSKEQVTFPPFSPNRIVDQVHLVYSQGSFQQAEVTRQIYPKEKQPSAANIENRVLDFSKCALFVWFSSNSKSLERASLMVYRALDNKLCGWYASFLTGEDWRVNKTMNMTREAVERIFSPDEPHEYI